MLHVDDCVSQLPCRIEHAYDRKSAIYLFARGPTAIGAHFPRFQTHLFLTFPLPGTYKLKVVKEYEEVSIATCTSNDLSACYKKCNPKTKWGGLQGSKAVHNKTQYKVCMYTCSHGCGVPELIQENLFISVTVHGNDTFKFSKNNCRGLESLGNGQWLHKSIAKDKARHHAEFTWFPYGCSLTNYKRHFIAGPGTASTTREIVDACSYKNSARPLLHLIATCSTQYSPVLSLTLNSDVNVTQCKHSKGVHDIWQRHPPGYPSNDNFSDLLYHGVRGWFGVRYMVEDVNRHIEDRLPRDMPVFRQDTMFQPFDSESLGGDGLHFYYNAKYKWFMNNVCDVLNSVSQ